MAVVSLGVHPTHYSLKENVKRWQSVSAVMCFRFHVNCIHLLRVIYITRFSGYCLYVYRGDSLTLSKCIHILAWRFARTKFVENFTRA